VTGWQNRVDVYLFMPFYLFIFRFLQFGFFQVGNSSAIHEGQSSNTDERAKIVTLSEHFLTFKMSGSKLYYFNFVSRFKE
jgi:hypothetical protein